MAPLNAKQTDYVERIHDSGQHLLDLINDILDLSRLEADRLELDLQASFVPDVCEGVISLDPRTGAQSGTQTQTLILIPVLIGLLPIPGVSSKCC